MYLPGVGETGSVDSCEYSALGISGLYSVFETLVKLFWCRIYWETSLSDDSPSLGGITAWSIV